VRKIFPVLAAVWLMAAPTVLVVTADGTVLDRNDVFAQAEDARSMSAQAVVTLLASWNGS
jgi:hypothetical protein